MDSLQGERTVFYARLCTKAEEWAIQPWPGPFCSHAAATAAMHCQPKQCTHPPPPVPPFLLTQSLSSKQIAPTDNMQPNFNDNYSRQGLDQHKYIQRTTKWAFYWVCCSCTSSLSLDATAHVHVYIYNQFCCDLPRSMALLCYFCAHTHHMSHNH